MSDTIHSKQQEIIDNFKTLDDWNDKYEYLIELSKMNLPLEEIYKTEKYLVKGCQSRVWVRAYINNNLLFYNSDSDAPIPKGIAAILTGLLSGFPPKEIIDANITFHKDTELIFYLSPARANGVESMINTFKSLAAKHVQTNA